MFPLLRDEVDAVLYRRRPCNIWTAVGQVHGTPTGEFDNFYEGKRQGVRDKGMEIAKFHEQIDVKK